MERRRADALFADGLISQSEKEKARIAISAYPHTEWGWLTGTLQEISNDHSLFNGKPTFRTIFALDQEQLHRRDSRSVSVRKGMTGTLKVLTVRRSLWQLICQDAYQGLSTEHTGLSSEPANFLPAEEGNDA